jgi:hypothetical protein
MRLELAELNNEWELTIQFLFLFCVLIAGRVASLATHRKES